MLKNIIHSILVRRHFWRYATFSEIAELYTSRMLRMAAIHMAGAFISVYMYQLGYSIVEIAAYWGAFFLFKAIVALPVASIVARIGPKHAILISNLMYLPVMVLFVLLPVVGPWVLIPILILEGISNIMYGIGYNIDFSKVKNPEHAGKEIGYMNIVEKATTALSPLVGGTLAFLFSPQVTLLAAGILFVFAAAPLLRTAEQVDTKQKLVFKGFPWQLVRKHSLAQFAVGFDFFTSGTAWMLYTAVIVIGFSGNDNSIYLAGGILLSVVLLAALVASYVYGKLIDARKGKDLMHIAVIADSFTHLTRPFIASPIAVAGLNAVNEVATTGYTMPYTRAIFDNADISGHRTTYIALVDLIANIGAAVAAFILAGFAYFAGELPALTNFFFISAGVVLLILTARFPLYKK